MANTNLRELDWQAELQGLAYAYGKPELSGVIKREPSDFVVTEVMDYVPSGEGEHTWLDISKVRCNTDRVARALAAFAGVSNRDVGYSGMKDFHAVTRQWFSVWRPKGGPLNWSDFEFGGVTIHQATKHHRKIKRATHTANKFEIRVVDLHGIDAKIEADARLQHIAKHGVPNYFGEQRFGRGAQNMTQALAYFEGEKKRAKDRNFRGILLSSARSWIFNQIVSARVSAGSWLSLYNGEPANLNGSNSTFIASGSDSELQRLSDKDIHPTAPMWGDGAEVLEESSPDLYQFELDAMEPYIPLAKGLESARLDYQRRPVRCVPEALTWESSNDELVVRFELGRGQFATSVLREVLVSA